MRTIWVSGGTSRSKQNSILDSLKTLHDDDRIDVEEQVDRRLKEIYEEIEAEYADLIEYLDKTGLNDLDRIFINFFDAYAQYESALAAWQAQYGS